MGKSANGRRANLVACYWSNWSARPTPNSAKSDLKCRLQRLGPKRDRLPNRKRAMAKKGDCNSSSQLQHLWQCTCFWIARAALRACTFKQIWSTQDATAKPWLFFLSFPPSLSARQVVFKVFNHPTFTAWITDVASHDVDGRWAATCPELRLDLTEAIPKALDMWYIYIYIHNTHTHIYIYMYVFIWHIISYFGYVISLSASCMWSCPDPEILEPFLEPFPVRSSGHARCAQLRTRSLLRN